MTWDLYLFFKVGGIAVFVFAGGLAVSKNLPVSRSKAYFINAVAVFAGFATSRLWYIVQHVFGSEPYEYRSILQAWNAWSDAGSVLYGWVLGGTAAIFLLTRRFKISPVRYLDCVLPWLLVAQFFNRMGCFDAYCCYGKPTAFFLSIENPYVDNQPVQLVQLYEGLFDLGLFWFILTRAKRVGLPTFLYFMGYPTARFFFEFLRGDNLPAFLGLTVPQVASLLIVGLTLLLRRRIIML